MSDLVGVFVGLILTLFIYSYLLGDNPLWRLAVHLLVGASAGYAAVVAVQAVLLPAIQTVVFQPQGYASLLWLVPLILGLLLFSKLFRRLAPLGNSAVAAMIAIGAAVALTGTTAGTIWPQVMAPAENVVVGLLTALATAAVLISFQFTGLRETAAGVERPGWQRPLAVAGRVVITITFGAVFAGVLNTGLILLAERVGFYLGELIRLIQS